MTMMDDQTTGAPAESEPLVDETTTSTLPQLADLDDEELGNELSLVDALLGGIEQPYPNEDIRESFRRIYTLALHACKIQTEITRRSLLRYQATCEVTGAEADAPSAGQDDQTPAAEPTTRRRCMAECGQDMDIVEVFSSTAASGWLRTPFGYLCPWCRATDHAPGYVAECDPDGEEVAIPSCLCGWVGPAQETLDSVADVWRGHFAEAMAKVAEQVAQ